MTLIAFGVNHKTAPQAVLDRVTFSADMAAKLRSGVLASDMISEAVVLCTCNRTEVYAKAERFHEGFRDVRDALSLAAEVEPDFLNPYLYVQYDSQAVDHLFKVAAGLESVVVGEHEIIGQVSRAWEDARDADATGPSLNLLFQRAITCGKRVRTETEIGRSTASLSHAAVTLIGEAGVTIEGSRVLLIGAGELGASTATALSRKYSVELIVANRTFATAVELADRLGAQPIALGEAAEFARSADIVISATGSPDVVLTSDDLNASSSPSGRTVVVDLAQPRDIAPEVSELDHVQVFPLSEVQQQANRGMEARRQHIGHAEDVITRELAKYREAGSARAVAPLLADLHGWAESIRGAELERYAARLSRMADSDRATVEALSKSIIAKILHTPTVRLRQEAGGAKGDRLAEAARELFEQE